MATKRSGLFYYVDCMNAFAAGLYPASEFSDDAEAIKMASDYEASLYKYEYKDGIRVSSETLYEPCAS